MYGRQVYDGNFALTSKSLIVDSQLSGLSYFNHKLGQVYFNGSTSTGPLQQGPLQQGLLQRVNFDGSTSTTYFNDLLLEGTQDF